MIARCMMLHKNKEDWKSGQHTVITIQIASTQSLVWL